MADKDLKHLLENLFSDLPFDEALAPEGYEESYGEPTDGLLTSALQVISDGVIITDADGVILYSNPASSYFTGIEPNELIGTNLEQLWDGHAVDSPHRDMWQSLYSGEAWSGILPKSQNDGVALTVEVHPAEDRQREQSARVYIVRETAKDEAAKKVSSESVDEIEHRNRLLRAVAQVSRAVSSTLQLDDLFSQVVDLILQHLDLYYAGVFLVDETGERSGETEKWVILRAGTGDAGAEMLAAGHRLEVGGASMIGWCVANGKARISLRAGDEAIRFSNPLLPETRSEMAIPLASRGRLIGALTIQDTREAAFSEDDISIIQIMADQLANAIENARLYRDSTRQITELEVVNSVSQAIAAALRLDDLMQAIYQQISRLFDTDNFFIATYLQGSDQWHSEFHFEGGQRQEPAWYSIESGLTGHIIRSQSPLLFRTEREILDFHEGLGTPLIGEAALSWLGVPLLSGDTVVGVMAIQDYSQEYLYSDRDLALFDTIASQVAVALDNARLYEQSQSARTEAEELYRFNAALNAAQTYDDVLAVLCENSVLTQAQEVAVRLFDRPWMEDQLPKWVTAVAMRGAESTGSDKGQRPIETLGWIKQYLEVGTPVLIENLQTDPRLIPDTRAQLASGRNVRAALLAPIALGGQLIGVVEGYFSELVSFPVSSLEHLGALVDQAAISIQGMRQYEASSQFARREQALRQIAEAIGSAEDLEESLPRVAQSLGSLVTLDLFEVITGAPQDRQFRRYSYDPDEGRSNVDWISTAGSLAAWVTAEGEPWVASDIRVDKLFAQDEELISAGLVSRVSVPLRLRDLSLGTLSLLSRQPNAYSESVIPDLNQVADQIALALERARLLDETRAALSHAEATYQRYLSTEWKGYLIDSPHNRGYLASHDELTEQVEIWMPEIERALSEDATIIWQESEATGQSPRSAIALPIRLRGQTIGVLDFYQEGEERVWSDDDKALVEGLADQIAQALENARLYAEAEKRAQREATIGQIVTQVRQQPDIDAILRTAVRELGRALGTSRTFVHLSSPTEAGNESGAVPLQGQA